MQEHIFFYYTNDFHSHFEQWPKVANYLKNKQQTHESLQQDYYIVDVGDHVDRVDPIAEASLGKANIDLLNELNYDAVTLGNNEGVTLPYDALYHLYDEAQFDVLCANLHPIHDESPQWLQSNTTFTTKEGTTIAVIGLTAAFYTFYNRLGWHIENPYTYLEKELGSIRSSHDIVILLSHLGLYEDERIAEQFPEIDCIIGGHTHHLLKSGEYVQNTLITSAGKFSLHVGEVMFTWDTIAKKLIKHSAATVQISKIKNDQATEIYLKEIKQKAIATMEQSVITLNRKFEVDWFKQTDLIQLLTSGLRKWTKADCAMLNAGVLLNSWLGGTITDYQIHRICPHPINPCVIELTGDELLEVVRGAHVEELIHFPLKGFGFRGEVLGVFVFAGLDIYATILEDGHTFIQAVYMNGEPIERQKIYTLATADTFTFGDLFPAIRRAKNKEFFMPEFLRDVLKQTLIDTYGN